MLELEDFTYQEVETLISESLKLDKVPNELLQSIYAESGGRPLFVQQVHDRLKGGSDMSDQCEDILLHRLDCLQFAERRCLTIAACLGNVFCLEDVEHILLDDTGGDDAIPCSATLDVLVRSGIVCLHVGLPEVKDKNYNNVSQDATTSTTTYYSFRDDRWRQKILDLTLKSAQQDVSRRVGRYHSHRSMKTVG
jgi:predicted ATPase